jgi:hypothetical protein
MKLRISDRAMLMALGGLPLKSCLGLDGSSQDWMVGLVHEEASPSTNKVISKVGQGKREEP